jgi:hypothetical protein
MLGAIGAHETKSPPEPEDMSTCAHDNAWVEEQAGKKGSVS